MNKYLIINSDNILENIVNDSNLPSGYSGFTVKLISDVNGPAQIGNYYDADTNTLVRPIIYNKICSDLNNNPLNLISGSTSITYNFSGDITLSELECIEASIGSVSNFSTSSNSLTFDLDPTGADVDGEEIILDFKNSTIITDQYNRTVQKLSYSLSYSGSY